MARNIHQRIANQRGVALLLVLSVTAALITLALETNRRARATVYAAAASRDRLTLMQMATSGVHGAMALLAADPQSPQEDSFMDAWADPEVRQRLAEDLPFELGELTVGIEDERSRIQVNALVDPPSGNLGRPAQRTLLVNLVSGLIPEDAGIEETPRGIVDALKDWLDGNDDDAVTGLYGAEESYYRSLDPPYACRNGPVDHIEDLLRVRGMTVALLEGTSEAPGLSRYLTVHGMKAGPGTGFTFDGKININTAPLAVIAAMLPETDRDLAPAIVDYREELVAGDQAAALADPLWYRQAPGCGDLQISSELYRLTSDLFRIRAEARIHDSRLSITAVVQRSAESETGRPACTVLTWEMS